VKPPRAEAGGCLRVHLSGLSRATSPTPSVTWGRAKRRPLADQIRLMRLAEALPHLAKPRGLGSHLARIETIVVDKARDEGGIRIPTNARSVRKLVVLPGQRLLRQRAVLSGQSSYVEISDGQHTRQASQSTGSLSCDSHQPTVSWWLKKPASGGSRRKLARR
jgi:hypothetical protein